MTSGCSIGTAVVSANVTLRPANLADWPMIRRWLTLPEIEQWWGPATHCEGEVLTALRSEHAISRIIQFEGEAVGYAHVADATIWGDDLPDALDPGTWDLDIFIAAPEVRRRGIGPEALRQLKSEVFATTLAVAVCIFPSIANERAVRAFEKAGFTWKTIWNDPVYGPSWFMVAERG